MKFWIKLLALGSVVVATLMPPTALAGAHAQEFRLSNGLRIIVQEDKRAPTVAHMMS